MTIEQFKEDFLWYVREISESRSTSGPIKEAVNYFDSLSDDEKASFIIDAYAISENHSTMYHIVIDVYNTMKKRKEK